MSLDKKEITEIIKKVYKKVDDRDILDWTEYKQGYAEALFSFGIAVRDAIEEKEDNTFNF